ncbi:LacI family transcriptional regulator [Reticulibacter mediterranei]|uniref:LacI family transcriptional regulator n=1 Tax=Reticulibacter mediterranei TaxID=2778369 RepID=A0A8J3N818_9CHLR|nr:LacI family DNA-binding transcriptional regulator [Reticulibacter mediterranei]GHO99218.1 LacI family transcriptional regulator [Reticulibacter mediterranei]
MGRSVTVKDIAQEAEVSIATVSRVLNNHSNIKDELRQRVLHVAVELGYFKTGGLPTARHDRRALKEIGFLLNYADLEEPSSDTSFWAHILHGAEREARKANITITYRGVGIQQPLYLLLNTLHEMRAGGILLVGPAKPAIVEAIVQTNIPLVLVDNSVRLPGRSVDAVLSDNFEGAKEAVAYLVAQGHQRIAFLGGYAGNDLSSLDKIYTFERRKDGYFSALRDAQLPISDELVVVYNTLQPDDVFAACQRLLLARPTALFCVNDPVAGRAMRALRELGVRIPEDISIVGFDDVEIAEHLIPPLTTVRVNREAMGATAVKSLMARIANPQALGVTSVLDVELIKRASVQPL